jgi:hypothetical protein
LTRRRTGLARGGAGSFGVAILAANVFREFVVWELARLLFLLGYSHPNRLLQSTGNLYWTAAQTVQVVTAQTVQGTAAQTVPGTSEERLRYHPDLPPRHAVADVPDAVRFTFEYSESHYTGGVLADVERLRGAGYELLKLKNLWAKDQYKGINSQWLRPETGLRFEVQFHTSESREAKELTHKAYERLRLLEYGLPLVLGEQPAHGRHLAHLDDGAPLLQAVRGQADGQAAVEPPGPPLGAGELGDGGPAGHLEAVAHAGRQLIIAGNSEGYTRSWLSSE